MSENNKADKSYPAEDKQEVMVLEDEKELLLDHEYDGIKELDNSLPPWWIYLFYITIIFGFIYFIGYDIFGWFDHPEAELKSEISYYEQNKVKVEMKLLTDQASLESAEKTFKTLCFACHGPDGQGVPNSGPNLTDHYWINGKGTLPDVVHVITNGAKNGMIAWKNSLGEKKIMELASYVLVKLQGSSPPNPKKPEGTLVGDEPKQETKKETPKKSVEDSAKKKAAEEAAAKKKAEEEAAAKKKAEEEKNK